MTSMLDDSFAFESLIIKCVLSNNEISYSLKSLIDIEAADYSFIDKVIAQIVCDQLQIKFLTLIKAKSIQEFNHHYVKKLITHVIYSNLTVQDHMINTVFMLITQLNQHQMILEKTWMNKINLVIDMWINSLQSAMKFICTWCWLRIYCLATVKSKDYQKFEWHWNAAWWWSAVRWLHAEFSRLHRLW